EPALAGWRHPANARSRTISHTDAGRTQEGREPAEAQSSLRAKRLSSIARVSPCVPDVITQHECISRIAFGAPQEHSDCHQVLLRINPPELAFYWLTDRFRHPDPGWLRSLG